jgi:hypothetical protein
VVPPLSLGAAALLVLLVIDLALVVADAGLAVAAPRGVGAAVVEDASCLDVLIVGVWVREGADRVDSDEGAEEEAVKKHGGVCCGVVVVIGLCKLVKGNGVVS